MSGRAPTPPPCRTCTHTTDLHGARAGRAPGVCHHPGCGCLQYLPTEPALRPGPDPRHDRDLFLAFDAATVKIVEGDPSAGYELLMAAVARWYRRVTPS